MLGSAFLFSYISSAPFVLQTVFGLTQLQFALSFAAVGTGLVLASVAGGPVARLLIQRYRVVASPEQLLDVGVSLEARWVILKTNGPLL